MLKEKAKFLSVNEVRAILLNISVADLEKQDRINLKMLNYETLKKRLKMNQEQALKFFKGTELEFTEYYKVTLMF